MTTLSEQVELLKQWYPLDTFDQALGVANLTAHEKKLTGFLYVALARIQELETAIDTMKKKRIEPVPEPVSSFLDTMPTSNTPIEAEEPHEPGRPEPNYRGRGWRQVKEPAGFNKYRTDGKSNASADSTTD